MSNNNTKDKKLPVTKRYPNFDKICFRRVYCAKMRIGIQLEELAYCPENYQQLLTLIEVFSGLKRKMFRNVCTELKSVSKVLSPRL